MRFKDLKGLSDEVISKAIAECPQVEMKKLLDNPELLNGKILVFGGNHDGFDTNRLCVRTFQYLPTEEKWIVADLIVYDMSGSGFWKHFSTWEVEREFSSFCNNRCFVMEA